MIDTLTAPEQSTETQRRTHNRALKKGSPTAEALYNMWVGGPITVVQSPPGAGKTTLVVEAICHLLERTTKRIIVTSPTNRGCFDLAQRLGAQMGKTMDGEEYVVLPGSVHKIMPRNVVSKANEEWTHNYVSVRTVSSCSFTNPETDIMIFDEGYQITLADAAEAADKAEQIVFVGDPGQIGPVITADVSSFSRRREAPHFRAPDVLAKRDEATVVTMSSSYRLGPETVDAISPLYDFSFESSRPDRWLEDANGVRQGEISVMEVLDGLDHSNKETLESVADGVEDMLGMELVETSIDGVPTVRAMTPADIAVVVAHNSQSSGITGILRNRGIEGATVGTADMLQGGQWHAVVALDPMVGYSEPNPHTMSNGRLCVMASRHMSHLLWVHDGSWETQLKNPDLDQKEAKIGFEVRDRLVYG